MRIGIDIKGISNGKTGIARYLVTLMNYLQKIDTENEYFLFGCRKSVYKVINSKWKKIVTPLKMPGIVWQQLILPILLRFYKINVIWSPEQTTPLFFCRNIKVLLTIHDFTALRFPETCVWSSRIIQQLFLKPSIKKVWKIIPVSDYIHRELLERYSDIVDKVDVITITNGAPCWSDLEISLPKSDEDYLFFAGNLEPRKNLKNLLRALEILKDKDINIKLHIAGTTGWNNSEFFKNLEQSKIFKNIRFLGYVSEEELKKQYFLCKATVYPSIYEGFGIPILEALSVGSVILTSRDTVMQEIAGKTAVYFDPYDPNNIAEKIEFVLNNYQEVKKNILQNSAKVLNNYSWEKSAYKITCLFKNLKNEEN
ncbi:MAG: glycosyltransferase family 4 protein [Bacteroidales bacterium]|nr:glycosyltransferase family 4 protein [Bacteroidales bacterium]